MNIKRTRDFVYFLHIYTYCDIFFNIYLDRQDKPDIGNHISINKPFKFEKKFVPTIICFILCNIYILYTVIWYLFSQKKKCIIMIYIYKLFIDIINFFNAYTEKITWPSITIKNNI